MVDTINPVNNTGTIFRLGIAYVAFTYATNRIYRRCTKPNKMTHYELLVRAIMSWFLSQRDVSRINTTITNNIDMYLFQNAIYVTSFIMPMQLQVMKDYVLLIQNQLIQLEPSIIKSRWGTSTNVFYNGVWHKPHLIHPHIKIHFMILCCIKRWREAVIMKYHPTYIIQNISELKFKLWYIPYTRI